LFSGGQRVVGVLGGSSVVTSNRVSPTSRSVVVCHDVVPVDQRVQFSEVKGWDYLRVRRGGKGQNSARSQVLSKFLDLGNKVTRVVFGGGDIVSTVLGSRKTRVFNVNVESN
jgi:hypothetical protein